MFPVTKTPSSCATQPRLLLPTTQSLGFTFTYSSILRHERATQPNVPEQLSPPTHTTLKAPGASASWPDLCASEQVPLTSLEKLPEDGEGEKLVETAGRAGSEVISRHWGKKLSFSLKPKAS